jgi:hypothetical protein
MKRLIPTSKFRRKEDNSDSLKARRREQTADKIDIGLLKRAEDAWMSLDKVRKKRERNIRYVFHDQWSDWVRDEEGNWVRESERVARRTGGVALQNNHLIKIIHSLTGLYAKQSTQPVCFAKRPDCDEASDMITDAVQTSWQRNQEADIMLSWMEDLLCGGLAIDLEQYTTINGEEDVYSLYIEPGHFFYESAGIDPRHWDVSLIGHFEDFTLGQLAARLAKSKYDYKQLEYIYEPYLTRQGNDFRSTQITDKLKSNSWDGAQEGMCRVYHIWTQEHKLRYRCKDIMDFTQPLYRIEEEQLPLVEAENEARLMQALANGIPADEVPLIEYSPIFDTYWHYQALAPDGRILEEYDNPYEHKSHPYVFKAYEMVHGDIIPFISSVIDQQRYINRLITLFDVVIQASAKGVTMIPKSCVPRSMSEEEFARSIREVGGFLFYDDKDGRNPNKPEIVVSNTNMTGITEMLQLQLSFIPEITSVSDALQGKTPSGNVAASRYAMETQNSTTSISALLQKFNTFETEVARKKMKTIHQYYTDDTNICNTRNRYREFYRYNPKLVEDLDFDVRIEMAPDSPTMRMALADIVRPLWEAGALDAATMLKASGIPASSALYKELQAAQQTMAQMAQAGAAPQGGTPQGAEIPLAEPATPTNPAAMQEGHPYVRGTVDNIQTIA